MPEKKLSDKRKGKMPMSASSDATPATPPGERGIKKEELSANKMGKRSVSASPYASLVLQKMKGNYLA